MGKVDTRLAKTIKGLRHWNELGSLQRNVQNKHALTDEIADGSVLRRQGKHPRQILDQIRKHGLIEAAEIAVSRSGQAQGFRTLAEEDLQEISYEKVVIDHTSEFSPRPVSSHPTVLRAGRR